MNDAPAPASDAGPTPTVAVPTGQLDWLRDQTLRWTSDGLIDDAQASAILGRYHEAPASAARHFSLARLLLGLGAAFLGVGVIWLVAANLDRLSPLLRFGAVTLFWLAALVGAEWLASRREHGGTVPSPVVGAARILAVLLVGAVIFQAAQSLQVPAYDPTLVGFWSVGALVHAYAVRSVGAQVVGVAAGVVWLLWQLLQAAPDPLVGVLGVGLGAVVALSLGVVHDRWLPSFGPVWRESGAALALGGLFVAALPFLNADGLDWPVLLVVLVAVSAVLLLTSLVFGAGRARWEPLTGLAAVVVGVVLVLWETGSDTQQVDVGDWAHAGVAVVAYVALALGVAVLGIFRDSWRLTLISTGALVVFTTFQSFAVFGQIITGAWLFLLLGAVLVGTGYLFDRTRRQLAAQIEGDPS